MQKITREYWRIQTWDGEALKQSHDLDRQPRSRHEVVGVVMEISMT